MPVIGSASGKEIPSSVVVSATAASYTVPAGFYAIVKAQVRNGGTFSVNGTVVLTSNTWNTITNSGNLFRTPGTPILRNRNSFAQVSSYALGALLNGSVLQQGNSGYTDYIASSPAASTGFNLDATSTSLSPNATVSMTGVYANETAMTAVEQQFKVPTGTVVVGSGNASYCIELYTV